MRKLGASVKARARHEPVPEDGYQGDYVADLAAKIPGAADGDPLEIGRQAGALVMDGIRRTLHDYRVDFDTFFLESSLHQGDPSPVDVAIADLRERGHLYESEGALWLRTTTFGDDKDRVLIKADGNATYFAADVAYHDDKLRRGFQKLINVLGADHHGYVGRVRASIAALGERPRLASRCRSCRSCTSSRAARRRRCPSAGRLRDARRGDRATSASTPPAGS